jgi:hypothetical protein
VPFTGAGAGAAIVPLLADVTKDADARPGAIERV